MSDLFKVLVYLLVAALAINPALAQSQTTNEFVIPPELKQQFPNAEFQVVSVQEYNELRRRQYSSYSADTLKPILMASQLQDTETNPPSDETPESCEPDCEEEKKQHGGGPKMGNFIVDFIGGMASSPEGLVVVLVVAGVILVGVLVFYAGVYLYELAKGKFEPPPWWEARAGLDLVSGENLDGTLSGLRFKTGIPKSPLGLVLEAGYYDLNLKLSDFMEQRYGAYWLAGPSVEFNEPGNFVSMGFEFLGGKSLHSKIGVMSTMKLGFNFKASENFVLGVHFGGLYTELKNTSGLINHIDEFNWLFGLDMGARF
jgi:hypothetical protein